MSNTVVPPAKPFEVCATGFRGAFGPALEAYATLEAAEAAHVGDSLDKLLVVIGPDRSRIHDPSKKRILSRRSSVGQWQRVSVLI